MRKSVKRVLIVIAVILVLVIAAGFFVGNYFFNLALNPTYDKGMIYGASHNTIDSGSDASVADHYRQVQAWLEETGYEDWYQASGDGLKLHAYAMPQVTDTGKWAILCHGYGGNGGQMAGSARHFTEQGFNVLMPDARGCGQSEGAYIGMGWHDRLDIVDWIGEILAKEPAAQIALYGISMGGATVMMVSGEDLPENVKVIVEDCGYTSVWDEFSYQLDQLFGLPAFPVMNVASIVTQIRAGFSLKEASAVDQVAKTRTPILFIHGGEDTFVPTSMLQQVYDAAAGPKEMILVEGAGHGAAASVMGDDYWVRVDGFIAQYMD